MTSSASGYNAIRLKIRFQQEKQIKITKADRSVMSKKGKQKTLLSNLKLNVFQNYHGITFAWFPTAPNLRKNCLTINQDYSRGEKMV